MPAGVVDLSLVIPIHNERDNLEPLLAEIAEALLGTSHEVLAVDDGSTDGSLDELRRLQPRFPRLRVVSHATRRGQSAAIVTGFDLARGQFVATIDADGQNDPADLRRLLDAARAHPLRAAVGYRVRRHDSRWKRAQSRLANTLRNWITGDTIRDTGCALKIMPRAATARLPRFDGMHRFLATLLRLADVEVVELEVVHRPRRHGRSKYGMWDRAIPALRDAFGVRWLSRRRLSRGGAVEDTAD